MRVVLQRVSSARVVVEREVIGEIAQGLLVLVGIHSADTHADAIWLAEKIAALRIFEDANGKMNLSITDIDERTPLATGPETPSVLVVSQFTLIASTRKGARPSFNDAAKPELAIPIYSAFLAELETRLRRRVATGKFGAMMQVSLVNDGPVTIILDSRSRE